MRLRSLALHVIRRAVAALADALIPAALTAAGFALVAAGLLTYLSPAAAAPNSTSTPFAFDSPGPSHLLTWPPVGPTASASIDPNVQVPTRVYIPALNIDLPVVRPPVSNAFPLCGAAEYSSAFSRPGLPGATFVYAHAREGMFLPLLTASQTNANGMLGDQVWLYTDNDLVFTYQISQVIRGHTPYNLDDVQAVKTEQLWLQTSEGPYETSTKLEVVATPLGAPLAADHAAAHPANTGYVCPDAPK